MRRIFQLFLLVLPFAGQAQTQDITGVWQGHFRANNMAMRSSPFDDRYKFEVQIAQTDKNFEAVTYSYLSTLFYGKAAAAGTINMHTGKVLLQEGKLLEVRNQGGGVCIMTCFLTYSRSGDDEFLEGSYVSMDTHDSSNCGRGTVFLHKVASSDFYKEPFLVKKERDIKKMESPKPIVKGPPVKKPTMPATAKPATPKNDNTPKPNVAKATPPATKAPPAVKKPAEKPEPVKNPPPMARITMPNLSRQSNEDSTGVGRKFPTIPPRVLQTRSNQVIRTIVVHTNEVTLNIYDDGAIDHDTVSVYLDNKQVISHAMLTDRPLILTLHLDETNDYHELVMVAENEGEIPPNTSLMIVKAGDKEWEVRITSTEQKNAVVTFKYSKQ